MLTRLDSGKFPDRRLSLSARPLKQAREEFEHGLEDDLNTAQALAAIFELIREANVAMDRGDFRAGDVAPVRKTLQNIRRYFCRA